MKEIKAYIKPNMLSNVVTVLRNLEGLTGLNIEKAVRISTGECGKAAV